MKRRALAERRVDGDVATALLDDAVHRRQSEAGSLPRRLVVKNGSKIGLDLRLIPWP